MGFSQYCHDYLSLGVTEGMRQERALDDLIISITIIFESFRPICMNSEKSYLAVLPTLHQKPFLSVINY